MRPAAAAATLAATTSVDRLSSLGNPSPVPMIVAPAGRKSGGWREASRHHPCPICEATRWCSHTEDGQAALCRHSEGTATPGWRVIKAAPQGGFILGRLDPWGHADQAPAIERVRAPRPKAGGKLTSAQCEELLAAARGPGWQAEVASLAEQLHVAPAVLEQLGVGWRWGDVERGRDVRDGDWVYGMRDGTGQVVGVHRRLARPYTKDGKQVGKLTVPGSTSGLFYVPGLWQRGAGPVLLAEGMTDTAALLDAGLAAAGRPSNMGGIEQLAELMRDLPLTRQILVVGENDRKPDGRWPGRDGAQQTAQRLADALDRPVLWAMVPEPAKDAREHLTTAKQAGMLPDDAGQLLLAGLLEVATEVQPSPKDPQLDGRVNHDSLVSLEQLRAQLRSRLMQLAQPPLLQRLRPDEEHPEGEPRLVPAVYLCAAPTGTGKSRAALELCQALEAQGLRVAYLSQTHKQSAERLTEAQAVGVQQGAADPELTQASCGLWHIARRVRACGMSVTQVLCPTCPLREACSYQQAKAQAKDAPVRFACHAMGAQDLGQVASGRDALIVDEDALGALVRHVQVRPRDLLDVIRALRSAAKAYPSSMADEDCQEVLELLTAAAMRLISGLRRVTTPGAVRIDTAGLQAPPGDDDVRWAAKAWRILAHRGTQLPPKDAMCLLLDVITGRVGEVWVMHDRHANGAWDRQVVGIERHRLPRKMVLLLDATADRATLEQVISASGTTWTAKLYHAVQTITPDGQPPDLHQARRLVPQGGDLLVGSTAERTTEVLRGALHRIPEQRLGLICHGQHIDALWGTEADGGGLLEADEVARIPRVAGHHTASVRGSNSWIGGDQDQRLDALLVMGCPNVPPSTVRLRLLTTGQHEAAAMPDGGWQRHQVLSTAPDGTTLTNPTMSCTDPLWREARRQYVHAALHQEAARARHTLPEGIPVYVITAEPMPGMLTDPLPLASIDAQTHHLMRAVGSLTGPDQDGKAGKMGRFLERDKSLKDIDAFRGNDPFGATISTADLVAHLDGAGWCSRTAKRALSRAAAMGLLEQSSTGRWRMPGTKVVPAPAQPQPPAPRPEQAAAAPPPEVMASAPPTAAATVHVRPAERPAVVIRTSWHSTPSTSTSVIVHGPGPEVVVPPRAAPPPAASPPAAARPATAQPIRFARQQAPPEDPSPEAMAWLASSTPDEFALWQERAAIMQHDGGIPQRQAEVLALMHLYAGLHRQLAPVG